MTQFVAPARLQAIPAELVEQFFLQDRRVLLLGQPGVGKTTLARGVAEQLTGVRRSIECLSADPGSPAFGMPGAVSLGRWQQGGWSVTRIEALCTLDAARFRLPLVAAVRKLADLVRDGTLLLDAPGVIRGVAGAELLTSLVQAGRIDLIMLLLREGQSAPLAYELGSLGVAVAYLQASEHARRPSKKARARNRTRLWEQYLDPFVEHHIALDRIQLVGTPPRNAPQAWQGKQVAFLAQDNTEAMGEVMDCDGARLRVRMPSDKQPTMTLLIRDACRNDEGLLITGKRFAADAVRYLPPTDLLPDACLKQDGGPRPLVFSGTAMATLMNGVFGDPLLHLRLRHQRRSLLFDLGDGSRLPVRIAHQVTDVFLTHAHIDHISGFLWLLRARIGERSICHLYGPPGLAGHIQGLLNGIHWDRIGDRGPRFEVAELDGDRLRRYLLRAGLPASELLGDVVIEEGIIIREPEFLIRAVPLDHGTPVLGFSYEPSRQINIRKERLLQRQLAPGPWLNELKQRFRRDDLAVGITLPNGQVEPAGKLADDLILTTVGGKLTYATDFADTLENRQQVVALAQGAHTLFCEARFLQRDAEQARRTGHLTTRACAEIANAAGVQHLIPFHFSRRYEDHPRCAYEEIGAVCPQLVMPGSDHTE